MPNIPYREIHVSNPNKTSDYIHFYTHVVLLCLNAIANNNIVPGQCAEYWADSVSPEIPKPIEYNIATNAIIIG